MLNREEFLKLNRIVKKLADFKKQLQITPSNNALESSTADVDGLSQLFTTIGELESLCDVIKAKQIKISSEGNPINIIYLEEHRK